MNDRTTEVKLECKDKLDNNNQVTEILNPFDLTDEDPPHTSKSSDSTDEDPPHSSNLSGLSHEDPPHIVIPSKLTPPFPCII